jgi:glycosyltransferase involved in cell wall biosynthesis
MKNMNIWALIPAYNEEKALAGLLKGLKPKNIASLVVDDGSTDDTYKIALKHADAAIKNPENMGKGRSLQEGINYLLANKKPGYILIMDADGQHSLNDIEKFTAQIMEGSDCVIGNRMRGHKGMPWIRVVTNNFMSGLISRIAGQVIPDTQCGYRLINCRVFEKIKLKTNKFEVESEIIIKASRAGFKISSVPIESIYFAKAKSKINPCWDTLRFIRFIWNLRKISE